MPVVFFKYRHSNENACGFNNRLYIVTSGTAIDRVSRSCFYKNDVYKRVRLEIPEIYENSMNTPTGASTNPKNFDLNKNLNMNLISNEIETLHFKRKL